MKKKGFTLVELLLVVIIIGILAAIALPRLTGQTTQARIAAAKTEIQSSLSMSLELYELDAGTFPHTSQGLRALVEKPSSPPEPVTWKGPYLKKKSIPKDPWGNEYIYDFPAKNGIDYDLYSAGPDGISNNEDDITNWSNETASS